MPQRYEKTECNITDKLYDCPRILKLGKLKDDRLGQDTAQEIQL